ncbi:PP2C family serine/threonine-protein phosphatase [Euzebya sp.]|uniref:PP2C family protein-serine/threonine phosphatase n=1 Tax=Euzebya sp. TaxID=1971409 RepID=UPI00355A7F4E
MTTAIAQGPRDHQEDRLAADADLLVVCDGMGGHERGDQAADTAIAVLADRRPRTAAEVDAAIVAAGEAVEGIGRGSRRDPGAVAVVAALDGSDLVLGWCGDSRGHVVRDGVIVARTVDHAGPLGGLLRCLGAGTPAEPEHVVVPAEPGDRVVVCSDGVVAALGPDPDEVIAEAPDAETLMGWCEEAGLGDNTAIVIATVAV